jgi:hypothetical protein
MLLVLITAEDEDLTVRLECNPKQTGYTDKLTTTKIPIPLILMSGSMTD